MMNGWMWECGLLTVELADGTSETTKDEHCTALFQALKGCAEIQAGKDSLFAAGTRVDDKGSETVYVEHKLDNTKTVRVELSPCRCRASIANPSKGNAISGVKDLAQIAPAIWFAFLQKQEGHIASAIKNLCDKFNEGIEPDEFGSFQIELTNLEAMTMVMSGPVNGSEASLPVLDKRVQGPQKVLCGEFTTFPAAVGKTASGFGGDVYDRAFIGQFRLNTAAIEAYRKSKRPEDEARTPERRNDYVFGKPAVHAYKRAFDTQNDGRDLAAHTFAFFGPPASGKSEIASVFGELNGLAVRRQVFGKSFTWDDLMEQIVPYVVKGTLPNFTKEEAAVNEALKADTEGRDPIELAREALGYPATGIEVKYDPDYAREFLGEGFANSSFLELDDEFTSRAREVLSSIGRKAEQSGLGNEFLGFKTIVSEFMEWFINGGVLELSETSTANPAELARLHDVLDFSKDCWLTTASGTHKRNPCCYAFITNNTDGDENNVMPAAVLSRAAVPVWVPAPTLEEATERLCKTLGCEGKKAKAKQVVEAYLALCSQAKALTLPGDLDFRQLKQIGNMILNHGSDPREIFEMEVLTHFTSYSDPYDRVKDESALLGVMDELELFR